MQIVKKHSEIKQIYLFGSKVCIKIRQNEMEVYIMIMIVCWKI